MARPRVAVRECDPHHSRRGHTSQLRSRVKDPLTAPLTATLDWVVMLRPDYIECPLPGRLTERFPLRDEMLSRHREAVAKHQPTYRDPLSGYSVFTAAFLAGRGYCCASGCRHCPYEPMR